jgi:phosphohistidine swiveling domain-containing protein
VGEVIGKGIVASGAGCEGVIRRASAIPEVVALMKATDLGETILLTDSASATAVGPLLPKVRGLICLSGGLTSHLAIVSREFGLPAVMSAELADPGSLDGVRVAIAEDGTISRA